MRPKKKDPTPIAKIRKIGIVQRELGPVSRAGRYWRGAYYMLPKFNLWIKLSCIVALLGALACLVVVFTRPRPILLVSFPDGTTLCSLPPLDPSTGRVLPRPSQEEELCAMLVKRSGRGSDKDNAEFAKESQVEPPAQERSDLQVPVEKVQPQPVVPLGAPAAIGADVTVPPTDGQAPESQGFDNQPAPQANPEGQVVPVASSQGGA